MLATVFSTTYDIGQLGEWLGLLGSGRGPESASTPLGLAVLLTPSLFLGPAFLMLMVAVDQLAAPERRIWSRGDRLRDDDVPKLVGSAYVTDGVVPSACRDAAASGRVARLDGPRTAPPFLRRPGQ